MQEIPETAGPEIPGASFYDVLVRATPRFFVTPALITANVAYFVIAVLHGVSPMQPERQQLLDLGAIYGPLVFDGEWWRLTSATFVHIGFLHLFFNMWCLWSLGSAAERMFGNLTFLLIYVLSGIGGSLASLAWHPSVLSAGASGAVFGIAGALVSMLYFGEIRVPRQVVRQLLSSLGFFVGFNLLVGSMLEGIDNAGHIGGLVVGLGLGAALHRPLPSGRRPWQRFLIVPLAVVLFVAVARMAVKEGVDDPDLLAARARELASEGKKEASIEALQKAVALAPESAPLANDLGTLYLDSGRIEEAIASFRRAVELDPQFYEPQQEPGGRAHGRGKEGGSERSLPHRAADGALGDRPVRRLEPALDRCGTHGRSDLRARGGPHLGARVCARRKSDGSRPAPARGDRARHSRPFARPSLSSRTTPSTTTGSRSDSPARAREIAGSRRSKRRSSSCRTRLISSTAWGRCASRAAKSAEAVAAYRRAVAAEPDRAVYRFNLSVALAREGAAGEASSEKAEALRLDPALTLPDDGEPIL